MAVTLAWTRCAQVDDKRDLEYQAGQEDEPAADQGKKTQEKDAAGEKDKKAPEEAPAQDQEEEQGETGEDGAINEDTEEGYEQRQFAAPQVSIGPNNKTVLPHWRGSSCLRVCLLTLQGVMVQNACADLALWWSLQAPEQELELPEDMALDGEQGDEEGAEGNEDDAGTEQNDDAVQQAFPEGADKEDIPDDGDEEQREDTDAPEGPPEEGESQIFLYKSSCLHDLWQGATLLTSPWCNADAEAAGKDAAKTLEEAGGDEGMDDANGPAEGCDEEEAQPAAQHGWEGEQPHQEALPEAGPTGLASQAAAAQVSQYQ